MAYSRYFSRDPRVQTVCRVNTNRTIGSQHRSSRLVTNCWYIYLYSILSCSKPKPNISPYCVSSKASQLKYAFFWVLQIILLFNYIPRSYSVQRLSSIDPIVNQDGPSSPSMEITPTHSDENNIHRNWKYGIRKRVKSSLENCMVKSLQVRTPKIKLGVAGP